MNKLFRFKHFKFSWQLGLTLILLFSIPRFFLVLEANKTGNYQFTSFVFVVMILSPFLLLTKQGRNAIGMKMPGSFKWLVLSFILGVLASTLAFYLGKLLYQDTIENWFVYISKSYSSIPASELNGDGKFTFFAMFALVGMTFSPIGEELMYRGLIHENFVPKFGNRKASILDSLAFGLVHLSHFGLIFRSGSWELLLIPGMIWVTLMYFSSRLFFFCKSKTQSIFGAILCHAGFNFGMTYFIFYHIF